MFTPYRQFPRRIEDILRRYWISDTWPPPSLPAFRVPPPSSLFLPFLPSSSLFLPSLLLPVPVSLGVSLTPDAQQGRRPRNRFVDGVRRWRRYAMPRLRADALKVRGERGSMGSVHTRNALCISPPHSPTLPLYREFGSAGCRKVARETDGRGKGGNEVRTPVVWSSPGPHTQTVSGRSPTNVCAKSASRCNRRNW